MGCAFHHVCNAPFLSVADLPVFRYVSATPHKRAVRPRDAKTVESFGCGCYEFREGFIALTIPFNRIDAVESPRFMGAENATAGISEVQRLVLAEIRNNPNVTHEQIAVSIGKGRTVVVKAIRQLREAGLIERVGSNKSGWWRVL